MDNFIPPQSLASPVLDNNQPPAAGNFPIPPKKKSPLLLIIAVVLVLALTAGLGYYFYINKRQENTEVTLSYWGLFEPTSVYQQVIADYEKENPRVKIIYEMQGLSYYRERLQAALAKNEGPDIFRIHQSWVPMMGNYLSPMPAVIYDAATFEKTFYPSAKESLKFQNQYVGIPLMYDGLSLYYNEDLFKAVGRTPPKTWSELKSAACDLTTKDSQGKIKTAGVALGVTGNVDHWSDVLGLMILQNGGDLINPTSNLSSDALTFYTLFSSSQACEGETSNPGAVWSSTLPTSTYFFATGNLAMYFAPSWRSFEIKTLNPNLNFKIVPVPQLPETNITWSSYWVESVAKSSTKSKEAWDFLKYLSSPDVLKKLYATESNLRLFGEPYPRVDMADLLKSQPMVGPFIEQAPFAKNWYLSSNTSDNGINKQIIKYFEDAVNAVNIGGDAVSALNTVQQGIVQVLGQYGILK